MSKHTQEPWQVHHDIDAGEWPMIMAGGVVAGKIIANVNPKSFCCVGGDFVEMPSADNARRIVACVNACRGLSTDELEQHGLVSAVGYELMELTKQRDELLEAAKAVVTRWDTPNWKDAEPTAAVIGRLRAILQKIEGCEE